DAPLFAFPALGFVAYGLGRWTPTPHDYFFPGRPDHRAEVEIVRRLDALRPPYMVTLNRRLGFFSEAPMYYFLLRPYLEEDDSRAETYDRAGMRLRHEAANALTYLAARETTDRYLLTRDGVPPAPDALVPRRGVTTERLRAWMATSAERRWIGIYAARALAQAGDTAAVPALEATLREERRLPYLQVAAGTALVTLGRLEHLTSLVG